MLARVASTAIWGDPVVGCASSCRGVPGAAFGAVLVSLLVLGLSGCSAPADASPAESTASPVPSAQAGSPAPESTATPGPSSTWSPAEDPQSPGPTVAPSLPVEEAPLDEPISLSTGMVVKVDSVRTTKVTPETPGEYAGEAVVVVVSVRNDSDSPQNVDSAVVTLEAADGELGIPTTAGPNDPLRGNVPVGGVVEGSYVFMLEPAARREVIVSVNYAAGEPVAQFIGRT